MKKLVLLSVAATLTCSMSFAKIWRVNNNTSVTADFTTAQLANDNVNVFDGDTIHLEPSTTSYGSLSPTKRLTWISTGAFSTLYPNEQFSPNVGRISSVSITNNGAENSVFHVYCESVFYIYESGVRIERCYVESAIIIATNSRTPNNVVVINSYCNSYLGIGNGNNHVITNNIFASYLSVGSSTTLAIITHNVFNATSGTANNVYNAIVENNIFNKASSAYTFTNSTVQYNMAGAAAVLPTGNNNQNSVAMNTVFVNANGTTDASFVLRAGSPAIGVGSGTPAVNLGAFGGASPFKLGLQPAIPAIYKIQAPAAPSGNTLNVTFSTKSNN
jgi:hypothetical protein